jgi:hypothetical protein
MIEVTSLLGRISPSIKTLSSRIMRFVPIIHNHMATVTPSLRLPDYGLQQLASLEDTDYLALMSECSEMSDERRVGVKRFRSGSGHRCYTVRC